MADAKISALDNLTSADPANDMIPIVDVSATPPASGNTKRISINNILACSPTATLASLNVTGSSIPANGLYLPTTNTLEFSANSLAQYRIAPLGVFSWYDGAGGTRMTLNSTGLGVGVSPSFKLDVSGSAGSGIRFTGNSVSTVMGETGGFGLLGTTTNHNLGLYTNGSVKATIDTSGNVGIGVTPSAWFASAFGPVLQFKSAGSSGGGALTGSGADNFRMFANTYYDSTSQYKHIVAGFATQYEQAAGKHIWYTSTTSGALNGVISFTQAMTLNASGTLLIGLTTNTGTYSTPLVVSANTGTVGWSVGPTAANPSNFYISGTGGNGVYLNGVAATSWTAISDERFKDIIEPISNAISKVGLLRSVIGKFKTDAEGIRRSFLIAQDVQSVLPEAVDASNPDKLGVSYSEVIPLLVAAIKELTAEVNALKKA